VALSPNVIQASIVAVRTAAPHPFNGISFDNLAVGLGQGIFQWAVGQPQNLALTGTATGTLGVGVIAPFTTRLTVPPNPGLVQASLVGAGVSGILSSSLALVVSLGVSQAFLSYGQYTGSGGLVGVGADASSVSVANAATLTGILQGTLLSAVGAGAVVQMLAVGLGNGIAGLLMQGTGIGAVVGTPSIPPLPGASPTFSTVV
jgi:hypothetical protein